MQNHGWFVGKAAVECGLVLPTDDFHLLRDTQGVIHAAGSVLQCRCNPVSSFVSMQDALLEKSAWCRSIWFTDADKASSCGATDLVEALRNTDLVCHDLSLPVPQVVDWQLGFLKQFAFTYSTSASVPLSKAAADVQQFLDDNPQTDDLIAVKVKSVYAQYRDSLKVYDWKDLADFFGVGVEVFTAHKAASTFVWIAAVPGDATSSVYAFAHTVPGFPSSFKGAYVGRMSLQAAVLMRLSKAINFGYSFITVDDACTPGEVEFLLKNPAPSLPDASDLLAAFRASQL